MNRSIDNFIFKTKAVLCVCLVVGLHIMLPGCGQTAFAPTSTVATPLTDSDALAQKFVGTPMAGAKAIEFDQVNKSFRVVYADGSARITGQVSTDENGDNYVSTLVVSNGDKAVTLAINANKEITSVITSQGVWTRPANTNAPSAPTAPAAPGARATSPLDQFIAANAELFAQTQQADELGYSSVAAGAAQPKADASSFAPLLWVLGGLALWPIAAAAALIWIVEVVVILNAIF